MTSEYCVVENVSVLIKNVGLICVAAENTALLLKHFYILWHPEMNNLLSGNSLAAFTKLKAQKVKRFVSIHQAWST